MPVSDTAPFDFSGALDTHERLPLAPGPTPLHRLDRLRQHLGGPDRVPSLWIKRDDLNGVGLGGNKIRKLEYLAADALRRGCDALVTAGAVQSNHARQTAAVGAMLGLPTHLCLRGAAPGTPTGNLVLDNWLGANLHFTRQGQNVNDLMRDIATRLTGEGATPYVIPIGGSNAVGALGYVRAAYELQTQLNDLSLPAPDCVVVATGSGGTQAGLEVGLRLAGLRSKVLGVGVAPPDTVSWPVDVAAHANDVLALVGHDLRLAPADIVCPLDWMGPRYGQMTPQAEAAIRLLARTEGIFTDPVYSGKALAALLDLVRAERFAPTERVVFWHTGGTPALFARDA